MRLLLLAGLLALCANAAVYDTSALGELCGNGIDFCGTRTSASGAISIRNTTNILSMTVSWLIQLTGSTYHYKYTLSANINPSANGMGVSHFALDVSDNCLVSQDCINNITGTKISNNAALTITPSYGSITSANGNAGLPLAFDGVRLTPTGGPLLDVVMEFDSPRVPVYGDFYLKLGQGSATGNGGAVWNNASNGSAQHTSSSIMDFIARPDTAGVSVPEPAFLTVVGVGLLIVGLWRRR